MKQRSQSRSNVNLWWYSAGQSIGGNSPPSGGVFISGDPIEGNTLTVSDTIVDVDGVGVVTYSWYANNLPVAIGTSLLLTQVHVGTLISVVASYVDGLGKHESVASAPVGPVIDVDMEPPAITLTTGSSTEHQPYLSGTVDEPSSVVVWIGVSQYPASVVGNTWSVAQGVISPLEIGTTDIVVTATDSSGNVGVLNTSIVRNLSAVNAGAVQG